MLYASVDGTRRQPRAKGERAICPGCSNEVVAVIPVKNVPHWRHRAGDCDPWSEPEGPWHLGWKERFDPSETEVALIDGTTGELHRADVMVRHPSGSSTIVELQHSPIAEEERMAREAFYGAEGRRMFWLLHLHDEHNFNGTNFRLAFGLGRREIQHGGKTFIVIHFFGRSQFFKRWARSSRHVFLSFGRHVFYLATRLACATVIDQLEPTEIALCELTQDEFIQAVRKITA